MILFGTAFNALAIFAGGAFGVLLKSGIPKRMSDTVIQAVALSVCLIGLSGALQGLDYILEIIFFLAIGTVIGEWVDIERRLEQLGDHLEKRFSKGNSQFSKGFVTSSLLYCVGAMAIMGALESGINQNHEILLSKSVIDGITAIVLASTLGIGVLFSGVSVFLYQGTIALLANSLTGVLTEVVVLQMSSVGGLLILGLGVSMLTGHKIKVGNMLPSILLPMVYYLIRLFVF